MRFPAPVTLIPGAGLARCSACARASNGIDCASYSTRTARVSTMETTTVGTDLATNVFQVRDRSDPSGQRPFTAASSKTASRPFVQPRTWVNAMRFSRLAGRSNHQCVDVVGKKPLIPFPDLRFAPLVAHIFGRPRGVS